MHLRRDVCLWHVVDSFINRALRPFPRRALFCVAARSVALSKNLSGHCFFAKH